MRVQLSTQTTGGQPAWSSIARVGPQVEPVPPHQLRDPQRPEWGRPVQIPVPDDLRLVPGQLVYVSFIPD
jgi:hypothetical protein